MAKTIKNTLLEQTKEKVESKLPNELQEPVEQTVRAGLKLLYSPKTHAELVQPVYEALKTNGFQPEEIANGMINLIGAVGIGSHQRMPVEAAFPAATILLTYVLDDLEQTKGLSVTPEMLKAIGSAMLKKFMKSFGVERAQPNAEPTGLANAEPPQAMAQEGMQGTPEMMPQGAM